MTRTINDYLKDSAILMEETAKVFPSEQMEKAIDLCVAAAVQNKPILVCGNGGSAADAMHIAGELVARFLLERRGFNCLCLSLNPAMVTAWSNDYDYDSNFARQVQAHGAAGGVVLGISTSGTSKSVVLAIEEAKKMGMTTIGLTGRGGGTMAAMCDALLDVPSKSTPFIQQVHACLYHYLCEQVEARAVALLKAA